MFKEYDSEAILRWGRVDGLGDTREQRVSTLEAKISDAERRGQYERVENLRKIYHYEMICLALNQ